MIESKHDAARKKSLKNVGEIQYLRLFVAGSAPHSLRAIENTKRLCECYLNGRYDLEVVDLYQQPELARGEQIVAVPTLIRYYPLPAKRFVGDMTITRQMLTALNVHSDLIVNCER